MDPGGDLVDQQLAVAQHEELDPENADIVEGGDDAVGKFGGPAGGPARDGGRYAAGLQDMVLVQIFGRIVAGDGPVKGADGDDRDLPLELDEPFEHQRSGLQGLEGQAGITVIAD